MEPSTVDFVEKYLEAGGAPFNIMSLLMSSYEGIGAMANMVSHDVMGAYDADSKAAILKALSRKIVESFDAEQADAAYSETGQLPEYIEAMLPHAAWRKTIYRLSERHPKSTMISAALQHLADQGYQSEMTTLNSAALHTHVFYALLVECLEKLSPANEENLEAQMQALVHAVCRREQTYLVAQYLFRNVRQRLGIKAVGIERIEAELENHMLKYYNRPQLVINLQVLQNGFAAGGRDKVANAVASIIQSAYAAPGDVVDLYDEYHGALLVSGQAPPPARLLRDQRVLQPIIEQAFGHLWGTAVRSQRPELIAKYLWLVAYTTLCTDEPMDDTAKEQLQQLVSQMTELRTELPARPIQTHLYQAIPKALECIGTPVLAGVVLRWIRDVLKNDSFGYYNMYFHSSEVPIPLLILEEIAYRQPLLKPLVFEAYKDTFESKVPDFPPEKQLRLQKVAINRVAVLAQLDYALPVISYFDTQKDLVDESVMVYFLNRIIAQFKAPYPEQFATPIVQLIEFAMDGVKAAKPKELACIRGFLDSVDADKAQELSALLPDEASTTPMDID
ncbi:hypothetical protein GGF46_000292 [Coemansia sp. RSA 552]|nr:hypothetical protein GGF46_000292 [Coemansia sp. RSA 552]